MQLLSKSYKEVQDVTGGAETLTAGQYTKRSSGVAGFTLVAVPVSTQFTLVVEAGKVKVTNKTTGEAWAAGQKVYNIVATGMLTTTAGTNDFIGWVAEPALSAATEGYIIFDGRSIA